MKTWFVFGAFLCLSSVIIGAFGAHSLKSMLNESQADLLVSFETGVRYQMYHGLAMLILPLVGERMQISQRYLLGFFISGVICFSVSIYCLVLFKVAEQEAVAKVFGPITPIGGLLLIVAWILFLFRILKSKKA